MGGKHETIADVVAAMRDYSNACNDGYLTDYGVVCTDMRNFADRIEAASERERGEAFNRGVRAKEYDLERWKETKNGDEVRQSPDRKTG